MTFTSDWLLKKSIIVLPEWIQQCSQFIIQEFKVSSNSPEFLDHIYNQYLMSNLCDIGRPVTSPIKKGVLYNSVTSKPELVLQVIDCVDVSRSKFQTIESVSQSYKRSISTDDDRVEAPDSKAYNPKRMLKFTLTDGFTTIYGMEYGSGVPLPIPDEIPLGLKIRVRNATINHQIVLLNRSNCDILGGVVDDINVPLLVRLKRHLGITVTEKDLKIKPKESVTQSENHNTTLEPKQPSNSHTQSSSALDIDDETLLSIIELD